MTLFYVFPKSGTWICGCDDSVGTVTDVSFIDDEWQFFVGTPCGWQWTPANELIHVERV